MTRDNAPQLPFDGGDEAGLDGPPEDAPYIYVATKITGSAPGSHERQAIELAADTIRCALIEAAADADEKWCVRVHAPVEWTSPEKTPNMTPKEVFTGNAHKVIVEADGMVIYGLSPSAGMGQEFAWAVQLGLPVLYLQPKGHAASRQIAGTPGDVTIASAEPAALKDEVRRWLRNHRHQIEANAARREGRRGRFAQLHHQLLAAWSSAGPGGRHAAAGTVGVTPDLIDWWLSEVDILGSVPIAHLLTLSIALTGTTDPVVGRHELTIGELEALITARHEYGWDEAQAEGLRSRGERELARPAVRRFKLDTPDDWYRLYEATQP